MLYFIKGNSNEGNKVIELLESKGGKNIYNLKGNKVNAIYYIASNHNNAICYFSDIALNIFLNVGKELTISNKKLKYEEGTYVIYNHDIKGKITQINENFSTPYQITFSNTGQVVWCTEEEIIEFKPKFKVGDEVIVRGKYQTTIESFDGTFYTIKINKNEHEYVLEKELEPVEIHIMFNLNDDVEYSGIPDNKPVYAKIDGVDFGKGKYRIISSSIFHKLWVTDKFLKPWGWHPNYNVGDKIGVNGSIYTYEIDEIFKEPGKYHVKTLDNCNHRTIDEKDIVELNEDPLNEGNTWEPKPGEKVLVRMSEEDVWDAAIYTFTHKEMYNPFHTFGGGAWVYCEPYDENKLGKK